MALSLFFYYANEMDFKILKSDWYHSLPLSMKGFPVPHLGFTGTIVKSAYNRLQNDVLWLTKNIFKKKEKKKRRI